MRRGVFFCTTKISAVVFGETFFSRASSGGGSNPQGTKYRRMPSAHVLTEFMHVPASPSRKVGPPRRCCIRIFTQLV